VICTLASKRVNQDRALQRPDLGFHLAMIHGTIPEPESLRSVKAYFSRQHDEHFHERIWHQAQYFSAN